MAISVGDDVILYFLSYVCSMQYVGNEEVATDNPIYEG